MENFILGDKFYYQVRLARRNRWQEMVTGSKGARRQRQRAKHASESLDAAASRIFKRPLRVALLYGNAKFNTSLPGNPSALGSG